MNKVKKKQDWLNAPQKMVHRSTKNGGTEV